MLRGLYTAASGMMSTMTSTDVIANNLANVNTVGFKRSDVMYQDFDEMLIHRLGTNGNQPIGRLSLGNRVSQTAVNFVQGGIIDTGNNLDLAISGEGFFSIKDDNNEIFYTRNGGFTMDNEGFLVTKQGLRVQGEGGDILFPPDTAVIDIDQYGQISVNGNVVDLVKITRFENKAELLPMGATMYRASGNAMELDQPDNPAQNGYYIYQGKLEGSNTNAIGEMINSITGLRMYETLQRNIKVHSETLGKAVNEVGRY